MTKDVFLFCILCVTAHLSLNSKGGGPHYLHFSEE